MARGRSMGTSKALKQQIVVRNEYTNNQTKSGKGSRGSSPGAYVTNYMAREDATLPLAPFALRQEAVDQMMERMENPEAQSSDSFEADRFMRYMARRDATVALKGRDRSHLLPLYEVSGHRGGALSEYVDRESYGSAQELLTAFEASEGLGGRAFGKGDLSLSHDDLFQKSDRIQTAFDEGRTVQKIVVSFTEDYLKEVDVLDDDFVYKGRGSYRGKVDQLKLRHAISEGMDGLEKAGGYSDAEWVGTLQFDTAHVHAHLAMVDTKASPYRRTKYGSDRGKINEREKAMFRKGVHHTLVDMKDLHSFHEEASIERQSTVQFMRDYTMQATRDQGAVQLLLASLPENQSEWRYGTNRKSMKRANQLATDLVMDTYERFPEESGYFDAVDAIHRYADESTRVHGYDADERKQLIQNGHGELIERSVNGLYRTLKEVTRVEKTVETPMLTAQASSSDELLASIREKEVSGSTNEPTSDFDPAPFALRVRNYANREKHHAQEADDLFHDMMDFAEQDAVGMVDESSRVMRLYYEEEFRHHVGTHEKYRHLLKFNRPRDERNVTQQLTPYAQLTQEFERLQEEREKGRELSSEFIKREKAYQKDLATYTHDNIQLGLAGLNEWDAIMDYDREAGTVKPRTVLPNRPKYPGEHLIPERFEGVKHYDIHDLGVDYEDDEDPVISPPTALDFASHYEQRELRFEGAKAYADATGQVHPRLARTQAELTRMKRTQEGIQSTGALPRDVARDVSTGTDKPSRSTIRIDHSVVDVPVQMRDVTQDVADSFDAHQQVVTREAEQDVSYESDAELE